MPTLPVAIDAKRALSGAAQFTTAVGLITSGSSRISHAIKRAGIAMGIMGAAAGAVSLKMVGVASRAQEIDQKFGVVFGKQKKTTDKWSRDFAGAVGRSEQSVKKWAATLQDTFVPMGFAREQATKMSKALTELAVDVGSFNDRLDEDVLSNFTSAMVGMHRAVLSYGVVINDTTLRQEALRLGFNKSLKDMTNLEKVQLRYSLLLRSTADAHGDAQRTAHTWANQMKRLRGNITNIAEDVGNVLLPSYTKGIQALNKWLEANRMNFVFWAKRVNIELEHIARQFGILKDFITNDFSAAAGVAWDIFIATTKSSGKVAVELASRTGTAIGIGLKNAIMDALRNNRIGSIPAEIEDLKKSAESAARYNRSYLESARTPEEAQIRVQEVMKTEKFRQKQIKLLEEERTKLLEKQEAKRAKVFATVMAGFDDTIEEEMRAVKKFSKARLEAEDPAILKRMEQELATRETRVKALNEERDALKAMQADLERESPYISMIEQMEGADVQIEETSSHLRDQVKLMNLGIQAGERFGDGLMNIGMQARNTKGVLQELNSVLIDVAKMAIRFAFVEPLGQAFGGFLSNTFGAKTGAPAAGALNSNTGGVANGSYDVPLPSAKGNIIGRRGVIKSFGSGDLFSKPTMFGMGRSGQLGVVGERGDEGVFPVKRDSKGNLGVSAVGTSNSGTVVVVDAPQVYIENESSTQLSHEVLQQAPDKWIIKIIAQDLKSGGDTFRGLQQRTAMSRR